MWRSLPFDGSLCVFDDIMEYISIRNGIQPGTERVFLHPNMNYRHRRDSFNRQHIGINSFKGFIRAACDAECIHGDGILKLVTSHLIRGTVLSALCRTIHVKSSIQIQTGHRTVNSTKNSKIFWVKNVEINSQI